MGVTVEVVVGVTVEVVDVIAHGLHLIAQITMIHVTMTQVQVTHHTTARIATALVRAAAVMMLVALAVTRQGQRTRPSTRWTVKQRIQKCNNNTAAVPSYEVNCASFHKCDKQTVVLYFQCIH